MDRLKGKVAVISGSASGIGRGTAMLFAAEGAKVIVADIQEEGGAAVVKEIEEAGGEAVFVRLDVRSEGDWKNVFHTAVERYGKVNVCVNNAGISDAKDIEATSLADWNRVMDINSTGVFLGTKYAIEAMKNNGENCSIVNRSSIDGQIAEAGLCAYCASKGSVRILTKAAALACGEKHYKIRVNSVHPGYIATPLTEVEAKGYGITPEEYFKRVGAMHPIGFIGEPIDIAYIDLYLASEESRWVTGAEFTIDGGFTAM